MKDVGTVLILDADLEELILKTAFPDFRVVTINAEQNARYTQITDLGFS